MKKEVPKPKWGKYPSGSEASLWQLRVLRTGGGGENRQPGSDFRLSICKLCSFESSFNTYPTDNILCCC